MRAILAATAHAEATSFIPHGGGAVAVLIASIVVAVIATTVAIEMQRNVFGWAIIGFVGTAILVCAVHAVI
jgi:hypothetical protein